MRHLFKVVNTVFLGGNLCESPTQKSYSALDLQQFCALHRTEHHISLTKYKLGQNVNLLGD